jgi:threonine synthase
LLKGGMPHEKQIALECPACPRPYASQEGHFACPAVGDGREHILEPRIELSPGLAEELAGAWKAHPDDPFRAFACLSAAAGIAGADRYAALADALQEGLARHEGRPVVVSPLVQAEGLARAIGHGGGLAVKDETCQPGGSHKVRHLAGTMLYLEALRAGPERGGGVPCAHCAPAEAGASPMLAALRAGRKPGLAISSCGNAALAAACVARASGYSLKAFVPEDVNPAVAAMLGERGAGVAVVPRLSTGAGDPCYLAFKDAVRAGAAPFCCSGRDNWANIEGGRTLGYETALQWLALGREPSHLVLQIGGGALARSVGGAFETMAALGMLSRAPRIHACQTEGAYPFARAWLLLLAEASGAAGLRLIIPDTLAGVRRFLSEEGGLIGRAVELVREGFSSKAVSAALARAASRPSRFMWAWDGPAPHSLAHGILDDETYDWYFLAMSMLKTGGRTVIAPEETVGYAHELARAYTGVNVSATGSSGLAGLLALKQTGAVPDGDAVGLFFTGVER